ncbi:MAG: hypothetical protein DRJ43_06450 [Thermoprotei archaeon]|nr:MAG: hypothetical protein DRJ43_06450 [Thermoprotei archaeon]
MAEEIKKLAEKAQILDESILERALEIYREIEDEPFSEENKAIASIYLACYESRCTAIRKLPKPKTKILKRARERARIKPSLEAIDWIDSVCELINRKESVPEKAREILEKYKKRYPKGYYEDEPIITASAAVYIASKLCGKPLTQEYLGNELKMSTSTIRKKYRDIIEKLPEYSWLIRFL